jgi:hypothetical protein
LLVQVDADGTDTGVGFVTAYTLSGANTVDPDTVAFSFGGQNWTISETGEVASVTDPIILDLGAKGISFTSFLDGVQFDLNADGILDQVAWTTGDDGILAYDLDGSAAIENGSELLSPFFGGDSFTSSLAALSSLDSNSDGLIDASDTAFADLLVWQDQNNDGISDSGELSGLSDLGITSLSLNASASPSYIDGQAVLSESSFTYADGQAGTLMEVSLDAQLGTAPAEMAEEAGLVADASNDTISVGTETDSFVFADPGQETTTTVSASADGADRAAVTADADSDSLVFADAGPESVTEVVSVDDGLSSDSSVSADSSSAEPDAADAIAPDVDDSVIVQTVTTTTQHQDDLIV